MLLLLVILLDFIGGIPRQLCELIAILTDSHGDLLQGQELLLQLDETSRHMVRPKGFLEFIPSDSIGVLLCEAVHVPPIERSSLKLS